MSQRTERQQTAWAGTLEAYWDLALALDTMEKARASGGLPKSYVSDGAEIEEGPYLLSVKDGVGVISIKGSLANIDSPLARFFGITTYADVRRALVAAAEDASVKQVLLDIDSGGGHALGVDDIGQLVQTVDKSKPVTAFTGGRMMSAAYWIGTSARDVQAARMAEVGSVGVIAVHTDYSKMLENEGIKATVLRAGKYKALGHPAEPLTDSARDHIQERLDAMYSVFIEHVAESRGMTVDQADSRIGQGREFMGKEAVAAGAVDGLTTYDGLFDRLRRKSLDTKAKSYDNRMKLDGGSDMRATLSAEHVAAIAEGAVIDALQAAQEQPTLPEAEEHAAGVEAPEAQAAADPAAEPVSAEAPAASASAPVEEKSEGELVRYLRDEIKTKDAELEARAVRLNTVEERLAAVEATHTGLLDIARNSISKMRVALGLPSLDFSKSSPVETLELHKQTLEQFQGKFKVGGVAVSAPAEKEKGGSGSAVVTPLHSARLAAVRPNTK